jgi:cytochrome c-type biogenesis protein CcmE
MTPRRKRLLLITAVLGTSAVAVALVANAFRSNLVFFYSPSDIAAQQAPKARTFRLGGLVESGSVARAADGVTVQFVVTDTAKRVPVQYKGILPDLFREGKGVVAQGQLQADGVFRADEVLAKHDENYMPPEAADAVERAHQASARARETLKQP